MAALFEVLDLQFLDSDPICFSLSALERIGISGSSGSGKSILLRALADLTPHTGKVRLAGELMDTYTPPDWRKNVAYLPSHSAWWYDHVGPHSSCWNLDYLHLIGFDADVFDWEVERLSSGERQRLAFVRLLSGFPLVLLLDEPTSALDPQNVKRFEDLLGRYLLGANGAVVIVSHDLMQLERLSVRHFQMDQKKLVPQ